MKNVNRLLGLVFVGIASTALFIACGDTTAESCLTDTDCATGFVCESELCIQTCTTAADCPAGDACEPRSSGSENICVEGTDTNNANNTNNTNNSNNANNVNNTTPVYVALIRDASSGAESCDVDDPGSDLVYVALEDETGTVLGYGELVYDGTTGDNNTYNLGANLDGSAPSFTGTCPEFDELSVTALGCGGEAAVRFLDSSNTPIAIESGMQIRVFEFGGQCSTGSVTDDYDVYLCDDTNAVVNDGVVSSCSTDLGGGSGETTLSIL